MASLLSERNEVHLITLNSIRDDHPLNLKRLERTSVIRHFLSGNIFSKIRQLRKIFLENHIDILFNYLTYPDVLGSCVGKKTGIPMIYNGIRNSQLPALKLFFEKIVHNHFASYTIFNCYSGAEEFKQKGFISQKCIVIPNCYPNISPIIKRQNMDIKTIITVGRFVPQKDYLTAIKSVAALKERDDIRFHIVGYGPLEKQIRKWIQEFGIKKNTLISINPPNVPSLLKNADIYLSTSLFEGTSNSIMEALNFSLPVVCTDVGDNFQLVQNGLNGFLHAKGDYNAISNSLGYLLDNIDIRNKFGARGNEILRENFSIEIFYQQYLKLI